MCLVAAMQVGGVLAQSVADTPDTQMSPAALDCTGAGCSDERGLLFELRTRGKRQPVTRDPTASSSEALEPDRRVTIKTDDTVLTTESKPRPGKAVAVGRWSVQLPGGGLVWAVEDPAVTQPVLSVQAPSLVAFDDGRIAEPVRLYAYSNYSSFVARMEIAIYAGSDADMISPLATVPVPRGNGVEVTWDGRIADGGPRLRLGDELIYVLRAYDAEGRMDETMPARLQLVSREDRQRSLEQLRLQAGSELRSMSATELESRRQLDQAYGLSTLRRQGIPVHGSRVRIHGQDIPEGADLRIDGVAVPLDQERRFAAEYILPTGTHEFRIRVSQQDGDAERVLPVEVTGRYMFLMALADLTISDTRVSGSIEPLGPNDRFDDILVEGRLAFYLKGKIKGKYLVTAHADTTEKEIEDLFTGFLDAQPNDIFRRLDPDMYYPVYGDDSVTWRDVDTQGRLYLRVDWDRSQALWGNFQTGIAASEYNQYQRSLYGAAVSYGSVEATPLGDPRTQVRAFAAKAQTAAGHNEFIGTGGSLYYLRNTDVLPGSDIVTLEIRDRTSGRVVSSAPLQRDVDYEIDEMQGRIILTRPLAQVTRENMPTLTRDTPLDGYDNVLVVDYEYVPDGFSDDDVTAGVRARQWIGDHVAVGVTHVDESRGGENYTLSGADVTLQAGRGTYLRVEHLRSESTAAPVFHSDNGGLTFTRRNPDLNTSREGDATAVEGRVNFRELGWTGRDATAAAWWRDVDAGYSVARADRGLAVREHGAEFSGDLSEDLRLVGRYSEARLGDNALKQLLLRLGWDLDDDSTISAELRQVDEDRAGVESSGTLAALRYDRRLGASLEAYAVVQGTLHTEGDYADNNSVTVGGKYRFGNLSSIGAEATHGDRGNAAQINAEYRLAPDHTLYGAYTYSTDRTTYDPLFAPANLGGLTLGQRWRISNRTNVYNESQWLRTGSGTTEASGVAHTFGLDFYPAPHWTLGFNLQNGHLDGAQGQVDRQAVSVNGGYSSASTTWASKLEWRRDDGSEQRRQWVTTNRVMHKIDESWRVAARLNHSDTTDRLDAAYDARFTEANLGFAWRPADTTRYALLGKYTYLYDLGSGGHEKAAEEYDQRSQVLSLEGTYVPTPRWEFAGKFAHRIGEARLGRKQGLWFDSRATFTAVQARHRFLEDWGALAEYRWLKVKDGGTRRGWLVAIDRNINQHFRVGVGYNFTDFSDNLTRLGATYEGWFLNLVGEY